MPLLRYVLFTSAMLLGLVFLVDWYFPATSVAVAHGSIDRTTIRIHSQHKWPEAIRMDTSTPLVTASPAPIAAEASVPEAQPATVALVAPHLIPTTATGQATRRARSTRHAQRERSRRFAQPGQRYASYRAPDWQGWSFPNW
ncbi:hypothetical protein [Bradyrhizobium sp. RD5-C2]|uniref:hypothetical protein n=1 Tax=Bradyrhizobium sp. RD5-C2 TaxID=244562 RepID=UPI001CC46B22|nr:hypothetical protein [Bradyrhizobium sp. RD5-C2]